MEKQLALTMKKKPLLILFCATVLLGTASTLLLVPLSISGWAQTASNTRFKMAGIVPTRNQSPAVPAAASTITPNNGLQYHGGPVMNNPHGVNVYYIWYGNWSHSPVPPILNHFINHIGGTAYFNINTSYYDYDKEGEKDPVKNRVSYGGSITDNYSRGSALTDDDVGLIIQNAATSGKLPYDLNGVYEVLTSADVIETSGFCTYYCAFHGWQTLPNGDNLIGGFIGNPDQCPSGCAIQDKLPTPNNSVAGDGMVNLIAHELSESVTDPLGTGWINYPDGSENGDLCAWTFGKTKFLPNGSFYNVKMGTRPYLIQQIWVNARGGYCALALDE
jgi:hypothetical protein